mmetsp:Transcript_1957/g.1918  ORF Transcript_1957/g.1918 Transcript_1957/m.1918 type:complete len:579 (+) Transcript_1957:35-1771(+)
MLQKKEETITLGRYLFERIRQLKVQSIFGVPGDFNLTLLDKIEEVNDLTWRGNANELNAAYAADGYSRVKSTDSSANGFACLVTTFGVGELSALNGIAGSYAEHVGLLHVVGIPATSAQQKQLLLHHTLGNGDFTVFKRMSSAITQTTGLVADAATGPAEIDRVIREAYINQRPSYLAFPTNMVDLEVSKLSLDTPIDLSMPENDPETESEVLERITELISNSKNPVILVDACCARHGATGEARKLIDLTKFKFAVTPMAKGAKYIDEDHERFAGVYVGTLSYPSVKEQVESSDLILSLGAMLSDFNTGSFSYSYQTKNVVEIHSDYTKIRSANYPNVRMKALLKKLLESDKLKEAASKYNPVKVDKDPFPEEKKDELSKITQQWLWSKVSGWLKENDIVITETGTSSFGIIQTQFPKNTLGISQILWGSIGYTVGATCGAVMAAQEIDPNRRVILFVGDGSLQLTVQEISSMAKNKTKPYIFVLNNNGYTIEKLIHGENADYNSIQPWDHLKILETFKADDYESIRVSTVKELLDLFSDQKFAKNDKIRLIELMFDTMDSPQNLIEQAKITAQTNSN